MNKTPQINTLKELASYVHSAQDSLSNSDLKVLYNLAKHVYGEVSQVTTARFGCGLGSDYMKTAATVIGSDEASLTAKHQFAVGVQAIDDQKKLYTKANDEGKIKLCTSRDFVNILNNIIGQLKNNSSSHKKDAFDDKSTDDTPYSSNKSVNRRSDDFSNHFLKDN